MSNKSKKQRSRANKPDSQIKTPATDPKSDAVFRAVQHARTKTNGQIEFDFGSQDTIVLYGYKPGNDGDYDVMEQCGPAELQSALTRVIAVLNGDKAIHNLDEFLEWRRCSEPYEWARAFYKYTDCGPWARFLLRESPAHTRVAYAAIGMEAGRLLVDPSAVPATLEHANTDEIQFLGFAPDGACELKATTLRGYNRIVRKFIRSTPKPLFKITVLQRNPATQAIDTGHVWVSLTRTFDATYQAVYYEKLQEPNAPLVDNSTCAGIEIGSIVEGSEATYEHEPFMFPFLASEFEEAVEQMEKFTTFYWERDNSNWYVVRVGDHEYVCSNCCGEIKWEEEKPSRKIVKAVTYLLESGAEISMAPKSPDRQWKPMLVPGTRATIHQFANDSEF